MRLTSIPALLIEETVRTWRRRLIAGAVMLAFGLAALVEGISAARVALDGAVGPVGARLILVGIFLAIVAVAVLLLIWRERSEAAARAAKPFGGDERVTAIAEAINLGYSLAQDFRRSRGGNGAAEAAAARAEAEAAAARTEAEAPDSSSVRREP